MGTQQLCLKWNKHYSNLLDISEHLLSSEVLVDVTLACEGLSLKAHKLVLSACSPFFQSIFVENPCQHPVVILKGVSYADLKAIVEFMYRGEVSVSRDQLSALLETAQMLQVRGLAEGDANDENAPSDSNNLYSSAQSTAPAASKSSTASSQDQNRSPSHKRKKRKRKVTDSGSDTNHSDVEQVTCLKVEEPPSPDVISIDERESSNVAAAAPEKRSKDSSHQPESATSQSASSADDRPRLSATSGQTAESNQVTEEARDSENTSGIKIEQVNVMDPSEFMEQSLEVESVPKHHQSSVHISAGSSSQVPSFTLTSVRSESDMIRTSTDSVSEPHTRPIPQPHLSRAVIPTNPARTSQSLRTVETSHYRPSMAESDMNILVPFCISSESSAGSMNENANQEPALVSAALQEASGSSLAGPSQQPDGAEGDSIGSSSGLMLYSDNPGVPSVAGPSGYQLEVQPQLQGSSQGSLRKKTSHRAARRPGRTSPANITATRHNRGFLCTLCNRVFGNQDNLKDHIIHHSDQNIRHYCDICNRAFRWRSNLSTHKRKFHKMF